MGKRFCVDCKKRPPKAKHFNSKYCEPCRIKRSKRPPGSMSLAQIREAKNLAGSMPREAIADVLGVSLSNLKRSCKGTNFFYFNRYVNNPSLVKEVCGYYEKYGKIETQKKYPEVCLRSIVERYKFFKPRQLKWTEKQKIELIKMSGFISKKKQAKYFNRPGAKAGSITSAWQKTLKIKSANVKVGFHVVSNYRIKKFLKSSCPTIPVSNKAISEGGYLWHDVNKHLKKDAPEMLKATAKAIAEFQEWLYSSKKPRKEILKLIKERA